MTATANDVVVLYGSQTGNAEDLAKRIGLMAKMYNQNVLVEAIDNFSLKTLPKQNFVIFVCSTTGHGQEPENMRTFYNFIRRRDLPNNCLMKLKYAIYGLGDSSYAKFNYVAKIIYKRLQECGAEPVQELVIGDEQHSCGCDGIIYPKLQELWQNILGFSQSQPIPTVQPGEAEQPNRNSYSVRFYDEATSCCSNQKGKPFCLEFYERINLLEATCIENKRVTAPDHFQDTRLLKFKSIEPIDYEPGDVCAIYPENSEENVREFTELLNLNPKRQFKLVKLDPNYMINYLYDFVPDGTTIENLVRYYLDIQSVPKRSFFEFLWPFSDNKLERDKLQEFASTEGQEEIYDYCVRPKRSILEVLLDFPNTVKNIKFEYIFDLIPPIKPRSFSIASASIAHKNEIHLIVGVVSYRTLMKRPRLGLCSNYLARMNAFKGENDNLDRDKIRFVLRRSSFKLPSDDRTPIVMIGPGLGIAPFRSFIEDRASRFASPLKEDVESTATIKAVNNHLYFGCRYEEKDFYFRKELEQYVSDGLMTLRVAFSRQQPKQYVQDLVLEDEEKIYNLIENEGAVVYVAGNSKLPESLHSLICNLFNRKHNIVNSNEDKEEEGEQKKSADLRFVRQLESANKLQYDCW